MNELIKCYFRVKSLGGNPFLMGLIDTLTNSTMIHCDNSVIILLPVFSAVGIPNSEKTQGKNQYMMVNKVIQTIITSL
jgi:hypothetical protein